MFTGSGWTANFRSDLLQGRHNFNASGDEFKLALYTNAASLDVNTTVTYTVQGEVNAATYIPGGNTLVSTGISSTGSGPSFGLTPNGMVAWTSFQPAIWPLASFTCRGALVYNHSKGDAAIAIMDFGQDRVMTGTDFVITFETADPNLAPVAVR